MANRLEDEALAYGVRFALGHACWIGGDYDSAIELLSANLPENMGDPTRIRDFGTAGSLLLDSMSILAMTLAHRGHFDRAIRDPRARASPSAKERLRLERHSEIIMLAPTCSAATQIRRRRYCGQPSSTQTRVGLEFTLPWHQAMLGYAHALNGEFETAVPLLEAALERSQEIHLPIPGVVTGALLAETLAPRQPRRALDVAETALGVARASGHRALEAELLRVKAPRCSASTPRRPKPQRREGFELAEKLGLGPEQGHGLRTLGDIMAAKGDTTKAEELHGLARAKYRSLGMKRWAEGPR